MLIRDIFTRYAADVIPQKAPATQRSNWFSLSRLERYFWDFEITDITPAVVYQYRDYVASQYSRKAYNLDHEVLSHVFTKAAHWGYCDHDPIKGRRVTKFALPPRKVKPASSDITAFSATLPRKWQLYIMLKVWTGRRKGELLRLQRSDALPKGLRFTNNKPPYDTFIVSWEPATRAAFRELLELPNPHHSPYVFFTGDGEPYIKPDGNTSAFNSIWQRRMTKALKLGLVTQRFTEHDLRKYRASQLPADKAQRLLRHTTARQTAKYRLEPDVVILD